MIGGNNMNIKPFASVNFCYKCGCPVPKIGITLRTKAGNVSASTPFICPKCKSKQKKKR